MEAAVISPEVLARYAGDAAQEVEGVSALVGDVEIAASDSRTDVLVELELEWGAGAELVARQVQVRVAEYLERMANVAVGSVDVVVARVGAPPARR